MSIIKLVIMLDLAACGKGSNPFHRFPRNKLARAKVRCVCCAVSFPKFHYNDLLRYCCGLFGRVANKSTTSL